MKIPPMRSTIAIFRQTKACQQVETKRIRDEKLLRRSRTSLLFNQREREAIDLYCQKYNIKNRSKFMREVILTEVLKKFDEDYPTLFEFEKPNLFYQR
jgi:hypothetical protein